MEEAIQYKSYNQIHKLKFNEISPEDERTCMTYTWCCMYSLRFLMMDEETVRNM